MEHEAQYVWGVCACRRGIGFGEVSGGSAPNQLLCFDSESSPSFLRVPPAQTHSSRMDEKDEGVKGHREEGGDIG